MAVPVCILAVGSTVAGFLQVPGGWQLVSDWIEPTLSVPEVDPSGTVELVSSVISVVLALAGIALAYWVFVADPARRLRLLPAPAGREVLQDQYRFDEVYEEAVVQPGRDLGDVLTTRVERVGIEGSIAAVVHTVVDAGRGLRVVESGLVRAYAFAMIAGVAIVGAVLALAMR
jgi:NADH-quinone oxidoreductase subunit L